MSQRKLLTRFLTLTLDVRKFANDADLATFQSHFALQRALGAACHCQTCAKLQVYSIKHINECWGKLRTYLRRKFGKAPTYIAVREFQKSTGMAHLHIVVDRFIEQAWVKEAWQSVGGGEHVDIRHIDAHRAAAYLSKYLAKDMLLDVPAGMRRVTTSRSIILNPKKPSPFEWQVFRVPIDRFFDLLFQAAGDVLRKDGELEAFVIRE